MAAYITREGDALDEICHRHYGDRQGAAEAALAANPGLAGRGPLLPGGLEIELPELPAGEPDSGAARLWD